MTIADLIFLLLAAYGLSFALIDTAILEWPRSIVTKIAFFQELLHCYFCTGFWAGIVVSTIYVLAISMAPLLSSLGFILLMGFASAASSYALQLKLTALETQQQIYGLGLENDTD